MAGDLPKTTEGFVQRKLADIERLFQRIQHKVFDRAPLPAEVPEGGFILARISGTTYNYTKAKGQLSRVAFTDV